MAFSLINQRRYVCQYTNTQRAFPSATHAPKNLTINTGIFHEKLILDFRNITRVQNCPGTTILNSLFGHDHSDGLDQWIFHGVGIEVGPWIDHGAGHGVSHHHFDQMSQRSELLDRLIFSLTALTQSPTR